MCLTTSHVLQPYLFSLPTRRSSDLAGRLLHHLASRRRSDESFKASTSRWTWSGMKQYASIANASVSATLQRRKRLRSEEHTSELQSRVDLVCRLLLEKKKTRVNKSA